MRQICQADGGAIEFPPRSSDLMPLNFYPWGTPKDVAYYRKQLNWQNFGTWAAIPETTSDSVAQAVVRRTQKCLDADGHQFEHLL